MSDSEQPSKAPSEQDREASSRALKAIVEGHAKQVITSLNRFFDPDQNGVLTRKEQPDPAIRDEAAKYIRDLKKMDVDQAKDLASAYIRARKRKAFRMI